jgi:acetyl esterase/lipase
MRPPFDPEAEVGLLRGIEAGVVPVSVTPETIADFRAMLDRGVFADLPSDEALSLDGRYAATEVGIELGDHRVPVLICRRVGASAAPVLVFVHGGGMVGGHHRAGVLPQLRFADRVGAALVSVGYRLAPEHPAPAQLDDVVGVVRHVVAHAPELGIDPAGVVLTGGSAGGAIAAGAALRIRDEGGVELRALHLNSPMLDDRMLTPSSTMLLGEGVWDRVSTATGWDALLGHARGTAAAPRYAAPGREEDVAGLPPVFLSVGSADGCRDEVVEFAMRLWAVGGDAELHVWPGGYHGFEKLAPASRLAKAFEAAQLDWLHQVLDAA